MAPRDFFEGPRALVLESVGVLATGISTIPLLTAVSTKSSCFGLGATTMDTWKSQVPGLQLLALAVALGAGHQAAGRCRSGTAQGGRCGACFAVEGAGIWVAV